MMLEKYIEQITPYILEIFKEDSSGHDISHLIRTKNIAVKICEKENGDKIVVGISAFMHDIHRIMQTKLGRLVSPKESLPKVREILSHTDLQEEVIEKICFCIEYHEEYNWNGNNIKDIDALILQDADNLEAIGAIGIARLFAYGASHNIPMYDEEIPLNEESNFSEQEKNDPTSIHHFYHKLFKLESNMNTQTAKELAKERTNYMREFVRKFIGEWNGNE